MTRHNKGFSVWLSAYFSAETFKARRQSEDISKVLKEKKIQPRNPQSAKLSFKNGGEIKTLQDKQKLREFITTRPAL